LEQGIRSEVEGKKTRISDKLPAEKIQKKLGLSDSELKSDMKKIDSRQDRLTFNELYYRVSKKLGRILSDVKTRKERATFAKASFAFHLKWLKEEGMLNKETDHNSMLKITP
jgi:hypothetical protein